jgi:hydroxyacyl-ACP dehydratase HTD2-like protein with hotdog domain
MSHLFRRLYSTSIPTAAETASLFLAQSASTPPRTHSQTLDLNQLRRLSSTLDRRAPNPASAAAIPACHHLVYFTPSQPEPALGADGTDTAYSPPAPFTRRMWAGGELRWAAGARNLLRVGQTVTETTVVRSAEGKRTRGGEEMVVVGVEKVFENGDGWAVVDKRLVWACLSCISGVHGWFGIELIGVLG